MRATFIHQLIILDFVIWEFVNWINLVQDRNKWRALVKTVMKLRVA